MPHAYTEDQLVEQPAIGLFASLESFLKEAEHHVIPAKEPTLFAVGGRGYYENTASDLLAFFLKPDAEHELGNLFLSTFLTCMKADQGEFKMSHVDIQREVKTEDRKFIDIQIIGSDWCLLIENKIRHWEANPYASYEAHARKLGRCTNLFAVLSPSGKIKKEGKSEDWKGVSYPNYCKALRHKLPELDSYGPRSKWQLFAREFILHLENELYNPPMTPKQVTFVENHSGQIVEVEKLAAQHRLFILQELTRRLNESVPGYMFETREESWAFRCTSPQWGDSDMVLIKPGSKRLQYLIRAYLADMSEPRLSKAKTALNHRQYDVDGKYPYWTSLSGYTSSNEAITELCKLAHILSNLLKMHEHSVTGISRF
jgi:hypothetical protein